MFQVIEICVDRGWGSACYGFIGFEQGLDRKAIEKIFKKFFREAFGVPFKDDDYEQAYFRQVVSPVQEKIIDHTIDCLAGKIDSITYTDERCFNDDDYRSYGVRISNWGTKRLDGTDREYLCFYWGRTKWGDSYLPIKVTGRGINTRIVDETFCCDEAGPGRSAEIEIINPDRVLEGLVRKFSLKKLKNWLVFRFYAL